MKHLLIALLIVLVMVTTALCQTSKDEVLLDIRAGVVAMCTLLNGQDYVRTAGRITFSGIDPNGQWVTLNLAYNCLTYDVVILPPGR